MTLDDTITALHLLQRNIIKYERHPAIKEGYRRTYQTHLRALREHGPNDDLRAAIYRVIPNDPVCA